MANTYLEVGGLNLSADLKLYLSRSTTTGEVDRTVIDKAIKYAEGVVNSRLGVKYILPVDAADETDFIKALVQDITVWRLYKVSDGLQIPDKVQVGYDEAMTHLSEIKKGNATIGAATEDDAEAKKTTAFGSFVRG